MLILARRRSVRASPSRTSGAIGRSARSTASTMGPWRQPGVLPLPSAASHSGRSIGSRRTGARAGPGLALPSWPPRGGFRCGRACCSTTGVACLSRRSIGWRSWRRGTRAGSWACSRGPWWTGSSSPRSRIRRRSRRRRHRRRTSPAPTSTASTGRARSWRETRFRGPPSRRSSARIVWPSGISIPRMGLAVSAWPTSSRRSSSWTKPSWWPSTAPRTPRWCRCRRVASRPSRA